MKTLFVVDDSDVNLSKVREVFKDKNYRLMTMSSGAKMFELLEKVTPDLILLDIEMPEMSGFKALQLLKSNKTYAAIPVIFLTSYTDVGIEARGFELGAIDFITKPFSPPVLINRIKTHLNIEEIIRERTAQLQRLENGIVFVLADIVENRDKKTGGHVVRVTRYIKILINAMLERKVYAAEISKWDLDMVVSSARMHDLGKITVSDVIMNKPGKLDETEFATMKTHAMEGERIIDNIVEQTGQVEFLRNAKLFAGYHHEHWDGSGYPYGLKGTDIPLQGRIMAIVDVYDALISERPYKAALTHEEAMSTIMEKSGTHYDPKIAEVFYQVNDLFKEVSVLL
ncbi:MAG: response regulator [Treponema sp.]|jgi:putative two-component system response regulator|nr:response regulator [Treponema sp.]